MMYNLGTYGDDEKSRGHLANSSSSGKMAVKMVHSCVCVQLHRATLMKRSRSTRDRERKDRIKLDLDELRTLLPKCATDKKMVSIDVLWLLYFMNDL